MLPNGLAGASAQLLRKIQRGFLGSAVALALVSAPGVLFAADDPILATLNDLKAHHRKREISQAAADLKRLNELAAQPEFAATRERLVPVISFYSGVIQFELRDEAGARVALENFLRLQPAASVDPNLYSKGFVKFFETVKKEMPQAESPAEAPSASGAGGLAASFASFPLDEAAADAMERDPNWGEGPVHFLFVADEIRRWKAAAADEEGRRWFQHEFWSRRDPTPGTPENEARTEFARRVQFADSRFSTETVRGSMSDRGMVFIILGPPSVVSRSQIAASESGSTLALDRPASKSGLAGFRDYDGRNNRQEMDDMRLGSGGSKGTREIWHYRPDRLAKELPFRELKFDFQTVKGYGIGVLQKDAVNLSALSRMTDILARTK